MSTIQRINQKDSNERTALLAIWEASVTATHDFLTPEDIDSLKPEVEKGLAGISYLYGCYNPTIAGFIGVENEKVEMLFVDDHFRGQGIGKKLLHYAIEKLHIRYVDVNEQNEEGLGFYQHFGFQVMGRSELDDQGRTFPILHLRKSEEGSSEI